MNFIGVIAEVAAFLSVWFGHVAVRKIEFISPTIWVPATGFAIIGLLIEFLSLSTTNRPLSTALGIFGITLLFDAFEFIRQEKRIIKGHAPANPNNPRHTEILAIHSSATTLDLLKRDPTGYSVSTQEASTNI